MKERKIYVLWILALVTIFVLVACIPADQQGSTRTPRITDVSGTDVATEDLGTEMMETSTLEVTEEMTITVEVTEMVTESAATTTPEATTEATEMVTEEPSADSDVDPNRVSTILDLGVWNQNNEQIGEVGDLVLNAETQKVDYVIVELGGFLGLGESRVPVPWRAVEFHMETEEEPQNALVLLVDQAVLENAPVLENDMIPGIGENVPAWDADFMTFWVNELGPDSTPAEVATPSVTVTPVAGDLTPLQGVVFATDVLGTNVQIGGETAGEIEDIFISSQTGEVWYLLVSVNTPGVGGGLVFVPVRLLGWDADNEVAVLQVDRDTFDSAPLFEDIELLDTDDPDWDIDIANFWAPFLPVEASSSSSAP